jgi:hypothetical protein
LKRVFLSVIVLISTLVLISVSCGGEEEEIYHATVGIFWASGWAGTLNATVNGETKEVSEHGSVWHLHWTGQESFFVRVVASNATCGVFSTSFYVKDEELKGMTLWCSDLQY